MTIKFPNNDIDDYLLIDYDDTLDDAILDDVRKSGGCFKKTCVIVACYSIFQFNNSIEYSVTLCGIRAGEETMKIMKFLFVLFCLIVLFGAHRPKIRA